MCNNHHWYECQSGFKMIGNNCYQSKQSVKYNICRNIDIHPYSIKKFFLRQLFPRLLRKNKIPNKRRDCQQTICIYIKRLDTFMIFGS